MIRMPKSLTAGFLLSVSLVCFPSTSQESVGDKDVFFAGRVVDAGTGERLQSIWVKAIYKNASSPASRLTLTDKNGNFQFLSLKQGKWTFSIKNDSPITSPFATVSSQSIHDVVPQTQEEYSVNVRPGAPNTVSIEMQTTNFVYGVVKDLSNNPLADAKLVVRSEKGIVTTTSNEEGWYQFIDEVNANTVSIYAQKTGYGHQETERFGINEKGSNHVDFTLKPLPGWQAPLRDDLHFSMDYG
jgi:hypothetical protein